MEKDDIRGQDSINSFKEVLSIANRNQVGKITFIDFILLGGDLFHDNQPSRKTMFETINLLR